MKILKQKHKALVFSVALFDQILEGGPCSKRGGGALRDEKRLASGRVAALPRAANTPLKASESRDTNLVPGGHRCLDRIKYGVHSDLGIGLGE